MKQKQYDSQLNLRRVMMKKNVSDGELSELIGVSRQTVNNWINGRRDMMVGSLHEVANALGVRVRDLFDE